jgi:hypothetical protein
MGHVDRPPHLPRHRPSIGLALGIASVFVALAAVPVAAKEFMQARLDAPIAMGTPEGTEIQVGVTVEVLTNDGLRPMEGSPVYVRLFGRDGTSIRAEAAEDRIAGHYTVRIVIPDGGARGIEVGLGGSTALPMMLVGDTLTFGGITSATAQAVRPPAAGGAALASPAQQTPQVDPAAVAGEAPAVVTSAVSPAAPAAVLLGVAALIALTAVLVGQGGHRRPVAGDRAGAADGAPSAPPSA